MLRNVEILEKCKNTYNRKSVDYCKVFVETIEHMYGLYTNLLKIQYKKIFLNVLYMPAIDQIGIINIIVLFRHMKKRNRISRL